MTVVPGGHRPAFALAVVLVCASFLYLFPFSPPLNNPNERTRVLQTRAMAERGELHIGRAERDAAGRLFFIDGDERRHASLFINDVALVCFDEGEEPPDCEGLLYPAKAPGTSILGAPLYGLAVAAGWVEPGPSHEAEATWWMRIGGVIAPLLLLMWAWVSLFERLGLDQRLRAPAIVAAMLGTTVYCYGLMFVGHATSGAFLLGGIALLARSLDDSGPATWVAAVIGGALTAYAVMLEYHSVVAVLCVVIWVLTRTRRDVTLGFGMGSALIAGVFMWLHQSMFRSPLRTGHSFLASEHNRVGQGSGFFGIDGIHPGSTIDHLFSPYMGLAPLMPWLAVGGFLGIAYIFSRRMRTGTRVELVLAWVPIAYLLFVTTLGNWRVMNGWSIGPRYLTPALLPLSLCAAVAWSHTSRRTTGAVLSGLAAASVVIVMCTAAATVSPPDRIFNTFAEVTVPTLLEGYAVRNAGLAIGLGANSLYVFVAGVLVVALLVLWWSTALAPRRWRAAALALLIAIVWASSLGMLAPRDPATQNLRLVDGMTPDDPGTMF